MDKTTFYVNQIQISSSVFEFSFEMNSVIPVSDKDGNVSPEIAETQYITMSPQHAKAFAKVLLENISVYENNFGIINLDSIPKND